MIPSTQVTDNKLFAFITVLVFKTLIRKVLFINRKDNRNLKNKLHFIKNSKFHRYITAKQYIVAMQNFQDAFEIRSNQLSVFFQFQ